MTMKDLSWWFTANLVIATFGMVVMFMDNYDTPLLAFALGGYFGCTSFLVWNSLCNQKDR